jgi:hypothetical protein
MDKFIIGPFEQKRTLQGFWQFQVFRGIQGGYRGNTISCAHHGNVVITTTVQYHVRTSVPCSI